MGSAYPDRDADGAGVTGVRYDAPHRGPHGQQTARSMVPMRTAVPVRAVVLKRIAGSFGSPAVPSGLPSDCAVRRLRPCHTQVLVSCGRRFRWVLG